MEIQKYKEIEDNVKALGQDLKPLFEEIERLITATNCLKTNKERETLTKLISILTRTARRHDLDNKVILQGTGYVVGTNHNGLGYKQHYSSNLTDLSSNYYGTSDYNERIIRDVLFDGDAVIDLTSIIKKSNQKTFLKVVKILKKYDLRETFSIFKDKNINSIEVDIVNTTDKIKVDISSQHSIDIDIMNKDSHSLRSFGVGLSDDKIDGFDFEKEDIDLLGDISKSKITGLGINNIKMGFFVSQHKESIIQAIKFKREQLNGVIEGYKKEHKELNDLLEPFLTLEKL